MLRVAPPHIIGLPLRSRPNSGYNPPPVKPPYHTKVFLCVRRGKGLVVVIGMEGVHAEIESGQPTVWTVKGDTEPEQEQETEQK